MMRGWLPLFAGQTVARALQNTFRLFAHIHPEMSGLTALDLYSEDIVARTCVNVQCFPMAEFILACCCQDWA